MQIFSLDIPVIGILRGVTQKQFQHISEISLDAGLQAIEITLNTDNALAILKKSRDNIPGGKYIGAGTVCNRLDAEKAIDHGAMFLVTPNYDQVVIDYAAVHSIPVVAGALTPSEIYAAYQGGAAMIKVFPCQAMGGPQYIKELRGPFDSIPLAAVGGVTRDNLKEYFANGATAVGVSTALFGKDCLKEKKFDLLKQNVTSFLKIAHQSPSGS